MVMARRSVHLTTLFPGQAWTSGLPIIRAHTFACNWQQPFLNESAEGRRMTVEIISWSTSTNVWDQARIELATPGSAVRHASVARHVTDCAMRPGIKITPVKLNCYMWGISQRLDQLNNLFYRPEITLWSWISVRHIDATAPHRRLDTSIGSESLMVWKHQV